MLYPLIFNPIFKERVWGGRNLERLYGKRLPPRKPIGESWEISDRPGDVSVIANGRLAGRDLHWLVENHRSDLLGELPLQHGRFPWLIKILDAQDKLSLQVHPPAARAAALGGEPKTEMWYIADAAPGAELYVGLRKGVTRDEFERRIREGAVAECFHRIKVRSGDAMFLPSGRVHAIGAGLVIFEIQQNSDTTYRVYDWDRKGLDGKPRELHVAESLQSIDFTDFAPPLLEEHFHRLGEKEMVRPLVADKLFNVELRRGEGGEAVLAEGGPQVVAVLKGGIRVMAESERLELGPGQFCLLPAQRPAVEIELVGGSEFLVVSPGTG